MDKISLLKKIGDISQICDAKRLRSVGGLDDGVIYIDVYTGSGLRFTVVESRGLDITKASYKDFNISYMSKNKVRSPYLYEEMNHGFEKQFFAGFLTTCGLTYHGASSTYNDHYLGTHGRYSNTPAEDVSITKEWIDNDYWITITGYIRESRLFGEQLILKRQIKTKMYSNQISITDEIINQSFTNVPLMLLYHFNIGYPLLDKNASFTKSTSSIRARDTIAQEGIDSFASFQDPIHKFSEQVFYHENFKEDQCFGQIYNQKHHIGLKVEFNKKELPMLIQWKMIGEGDYVLGIEPATNTPEGFVKEMEKGNIHFLKPMERKIIHLNLKVLD